MWRNDIKCKDIFMFSLKNLACKGLIWQLPTKLTLSLEKGTVDQLIFIFLPSWAQGMMAWCHSVCHWLCSGAPWPSPGPSRHHYHCWTHPHSRLAVGSAVLLEKNNPEIINPLYTKLLWSIDIYLTALLEKNNEMMINRPHCFWRIIMFSLIFQ